MSGILLAAAFATQITTVPVGRVFVTTPQTVALANADQNVVVMSEEYYASMTNYFAQVNEFMSTQVRVANATSQSRVLWHGEKTDTIVNNEDHTRTTVYADGFKFVEKMTVRKVASPEQRAKIQDLHRKAKERLQARKDIPEGLKQVLERREASKTVKEITVRRNGNTGKDE